MEEEEEEEDDDDDDVTRDLLHYVAGRYCISVLSVINKLPLTNFRAAKQVCLIINSFVASIL
jgi:hypothetical protein